jgi:hypothetical protein
VGEGDVIGCGAFDGQAAFVDSDVVSVALEDQVGRIVRAVLGARHDVVDLEVLRRAAARDLTAAMIAAPDMAARARRDVLRGARTHVGADALGVALGGGDPGRLEIDVDAGGVAGGAFTLRAECQRDLVGRAGLVAGAEGAVGEQAQRGVVIEDVADFELELTASLAHRGEGVGRDLEAKHARDGLRVGRIVGAVAGAAARHHALDVADRVAAGGVDPLALRRRNRDAGQLAHRRPGQRAGRERGAKVGQIEQRLGDAQLFRGQARGVPEQPLEIFEVAAVPERLVSAGALALDEPVRLVGVVRGLGVR